MKKPISYFGFAWDDPTEGFSEEYKNSEHGKKEIEKSKKRQKELQKFYKENGFDPSETWNLFYTITKFTHPRLKYFRDNYHGYPFDLSDKKWLKILNKMVESFEIIERDDFDELQKEKKKVQEGLKLFSKYFLNLWD